ncbi:MAG: DNA polymerase III subunit gamma/tau [Bacilli bacterium]|nr:DNA polymerase III subunit gamma/tau [Bacilli bacterium]
MYQALYRKYRPNNFSDVTGQEIIIKTLKNAVENNKISHAYLFTGPRGTGKTSIAKILAKTVNCNDLKDSTPCDKCVNCTQINSKTSTDIIEIDAASNNGVDEIREIRNKVNLVPSTGKYKVYIIDEVHMLTTGAFNALLKTLEEPPSHAIFILATTEPHKIPATIMSRCQRFDFKRIPNEKIVLRLKYIVEQENLNVDEEALYEIARISDGGMRDSISLLDQLVSYNPVNANIDDVHEINGSLSNKRLKAFITNILNKDITNVLNDIDEFYSNGKSLIKITESIINFLKNVLLLKVSRDYLLSKVDEISDYEEVLKMASIEQITELITKFNNEINDIKISSDPKLSMEILIIKECSKMGENISREIVLETKENKNTIIMNEEKAIQINREIIKTQTNVLEKESDVLVEEKKEIYIESEEVKKVNLKLDELIELRVNNTLAKFNKGLLKNIKEQLSGVSDYLLDDRYSKYASILLDGELKAASDENMIFVYQTKNTSDEFNINILLIEELISQLLEKNYKVISVDIEKWEIIKNEFNNKQKKYDYIPETSELLSCLINSNQEINELDNIFGDIVNYE